MSFGSVGCGCWMGRWIEISEIFLLLGIDEGLLWFIEVEYLLVERFS